MKILFVADISIVNVTSGSERVLYEQCTRLARKGHEVYLLTRRLPYHQSQGETIDGVKEWRYSFRKELTYPLLKSIFLDCRHSFNSIQKNSFLHIINFHQPFSAAGVLSSRSSRSIPTVYTCHSLSFQEYASQSSPPANSKEWISYWMQRFGRKLVEKRVLKKSDSIVVLSDYTRENLKKAYGLPTAKIDVIPGGVDLHRFRPPKDKLAVRRRFSIPDGHFLLFTVRNLEPRMGLENLILALKEIVKERKDILLTVGGEGPLTQDLKSLARESGVEESVKFVGYIPEEELPYYYQMADLFILPTKELEGFGLVTVEALASGLPVLGTPVGGTKEILAHMGPEFFFSDVTPNSMSRLILKSMQGWATNPEIYNEISRKCRKVAENHYSWDAHVAKLENLFRLAIQQRNSSLHSDP
jgi:glycosyltransferase involved in cell wall biosynthesis